jgi:hypothetical protein
MDPQRLHGDFRESAIWTLEFCSNIPRRQIRLYDYLSGPLFPKEAFWILRINSIFTFNNLTECSFAPEADTGFIVPSSMPKPIRRRDVLGASFALFAMIE